MGVLKTVFGTDDWDSILSYRTVAMVVIRDRRLGALNLGLMIAIVIFVLLQLLMGGTYLSSSDAAGTARFTLLQPTSNCTYEDREEGRTDCIPCDPTKPPCYDDFPDVQSLPYCNQSAVPAPGNYKKRLCRFEESVSSSKVFQSSMIVATRGRELQELKACSASPLSPLYKGGVCNNVYNITNDPESDTFYYASMEKFSVNIFHTITSPMQKTCTEMNGALHVPNNHELCKTLPNALESYPDGARATSAPCWVVPVDGAYGSDIFQLSTLLSAADTSLSESLFPGSRHTIRDSGSILVLNIEYSNWKPWEVMFATAAPRYEYHLTLLHNTSTMTTETIYDDYPDRRTTLLRWGVYLVSVQSGNVRTFSIMQLLITVTTSLTLISITTVLVDTISTSIMGDSSLYKDYKLKVTPDLSDVKDGKSCATCSRDLTKVTSSAPCHCPICDKSFPEKTVLYRCDRCAHDRCVSCLAKSTLNKTLVTSLFSLCLQRYDTDDKGYLSTKEMAQFEEDCQGDVSRVPDGEGADVFIEFLNSLSADEKEHRRALLGCEEIPGRLLTVQEPGINDPLGKPLLQQEGSHVI